VQTEITEHMVHPDGVLVNFSYYTVIEANNNLRRSNAWTRS
jgi:hypothetical protein